MTHEARIQEALYCFYFVVIQRGVMKNKSFKYDQLPPVMDWKVGDNIRRIYWANRSEDTFEALMTNQLRAALMIAVIATDSALTDCFAKGENKEPYNDSDSERRAARCIIHMIRCAFAHQPLEPKWNVTGDEYKNVFTVKSLNFSLDTRTLNGKSLDQDTFPWFQVIDLMEFCKTLVK